LSVFEATAPFAFFDYFRVPYRVVSSPAGVPVGYAALWRTGTGETTGPMLTWPLSDGSATDISVPGRYLLEGFTIFGGVVPDATAAWLLEPLGSGWSVIAAILDGDARQVASVRRDHRGSVFIPFDPSEVMWRYWSERYQDTERSALAAKLRAAVLRAYYLGRPLLPRSLQIKLRQVFARAQGVPTFPRWPVETSLHDLYDWLFELVASFARAPVPWIDIWPDGHSWSMVLTHDVEAKAGYERMSLLRDVEREAGYRSSWNFVPLREPPEGRYDVGSDVLAWLADEGCEVGVHGLHHDGRDLASFSILRKRLPTIRAFADRWEAVGFRAPATQRDWDWMPLLGFSYDSSFADSDPYEPTPGGCCSLYPFFNEGMVELPITLPQDHTVYTILERTDASLWLTKAEHIRESGGMALVLTHPDYADDSNMVDGYRRLLETHGDDPSAWRALPSEVDAWWRARAASSLEATGDGWAIKGPASGRGRVLLRTPATSAEGRSDVSRAVGPATV
jgi:hypothetical protein